MKTAENTLDQEGLRDSFFFVISICDSYFQLQFALFIIGRVMAYVMISIIRKIVVMTEETAVVEMLSINFASIAAALVYTVSKNRCHTPSK